MSHDMLLANLMVSYEGDKRSYKAGATIMTELLEAL